MMAASCKKRTLSLSDEPDLRVLTAISLVVPEMDHRALQTYPNSPDPRAFKVLVQNNVFRSKFYLYFNSTFLSNLKAILEHNHTLFDVLGSLGTFLRQAESKGQRSWMQGPSRSDLL